MRYSRSRKQLTMKAGTTPASKKPRKKRWAYAPCQLVQAGAVRKMAPQVTTIAEHAFEMGSF
jgi:hypothetical protein